MDTAGIRDTEDVVEKIGVDRAKEYADKADLILYVIDASRPLDENDAEILHLIKGKRAIILLNKSDLDMQVTKRNRKETAGKNFPGDRDLCKECTGNRRAGRYVKRRCSSREN